MKGWNNEIFKALAHPIRRRIIECLRETNALSYNELLKLVDTKNHGKLGFHMRALKGLVEHESSTNKYRLTDRGQIAGELIWDIMFIISRGGRDLAQEPTRYVQNLKFGDHALFLYNTEDDRREIAFSYLKAGLPKGEAIVFLVPEQKIDSENQEIQRYGISGDYFRNEAFTIMSAEEWYLKKGRAQAKTIMDNWLKLLKVKQKAGFAGLRAAGEMGVFLENSKEKELLKYEAALGRKFAFAICGLCLYDIGKLDESQVARLTRLHGHLISKDMAWKIA